MMQNRGNLRRSSCPTLLAPFTTLNPAHLLNWATLIEFKAYQCALSWAALIEFMGYQCAFPNFKLPPFLGKCTQDFNPLSPETFYILTPSPKIFLGKMTCCGFSWYLLTKKTSWVG
jgi:hypothetical protein